MESVEVLTYVKAISNNSSEMERSRGSYSVLEVIKLLLMQRLIEPNELSMVAINLLA